MKCGNCGSGITAQEKTKELFDGSIKKYTYYNCTRSKDIDCDQPFLRERDLVEQLIAMIDDIDLDESGLAESLESEMGRFQKFQALLGKDTEDIAAGSDELDIRNYAKYILQEGSTGEKRQLMRSLDSRLAISSKELVLS